MRGVIGFLLVLFLSSCALVEKGERNEGFSYTLRERDYADHLASIRADYINLFNARLIKLDKKSSRYLVRLYDRIVSNKVLCWSKISSPISYHQ